MKRGRLNLFEVTVNQVPFNLTAGPLLLLLGLHSNRRDAVTKVTITIDKEGNRVFCACCVTSVLPPSVCVCRRVLPSDTAVAVRVCVVMLSKQTQDQFHASTFNFGS